MCSFPGLALSLLKQTLIGPVDKYRCDSCCVRKCILKRPNVRKSTYLLTLMIHDPFVSQSKSSWLIQGLRCLLYEGASTACILVAEKLSQIILFGSSHWCCPVKPFLILSNNVKLSFDSWKIISSKSWMNLRSFCSGDVGASEEGGNEIFPKFY